MYPYEDPVFRQKEVLFPDYIPDHLPHREKEIKAVSSILNSALKNPANIRTSSSLARREPGKPLQSSSSSESLKKKQQPFRFT